MKAMKKILSIAVGITVATMSQANLLSNGGFETGTFAGWSVNGLTLPTIVADGHSGSFAASFAGSGSSNWISQSFFANSGWTYDVKLYIKNNGVGDDRFYVQLGGSTPVDMAPIAYPLESWSEVSFQWVADTTGPDAITIGGFDPNTFQIDDVSVVVSSVPEPATIASLGLGALAIARRARRRQS